jgi:hypothetical protein
MRRDGRSFAMRGRAKLVLAAQLIAILVGLAGCFGTTADEMRTGEENRRLNDLYSRRDCC